MVFSSNVFLLYFMPIFFAVYFLTPRKIRNYVLLFASLLFYAYGAPEFIIHLILSTIANFYLVRWMMKAKEKENGKWKTENFPFSVLPPIRSVSPSGFRFPLSKLLCGLSIAISIGLLFYFKYGNFTMQNLNTILGWAGFKSLSWTKILLPIGISFFSFQSVTYTLDTYRGVNEPMERLSDYLLYIVMFPQLIAGPIVRYCDIADQIRNRESLYTDRLHGFYRFVLGLCKKVLIADVIGFQVDQVLGPSNYDVLTSAQLADIANKIATIDSTTAWITILAFTFQIYFDFAGYSDMAIGLGRMMGFRFPENFDNPYVSTTISEFWRRWHQTFSVFIKNYLYFPLGGSRVKTEARKYFNLWFCFLVSGLWHGAAWNFVVYGALQGIFICADKLFLKKFNERIGRIPSVFFTFCIIVLTRCFFRIERIDLSWLFIKRLFAFDFVPFHFGENPHLYVTMLIAAFFSFFTLSKFGLKVQDKVYFTEYNKRQHIVAFVVSLCAFVFCLGALNATGFSPFIYFRF